jgi:YidC/Oxa1 family membrane protein insertase
VIVFANIFQPLIDVFEAVLQFFHDNVGLTWGLSIIAMTVVVRAAILPLTLRQMKSMRRLQTLSPKIKELQAKYKGDKQRQNEEMMKFYRENQVNPLGSCLPLLLQLPVFISLFYMLRTDLKKDICPPIVDYVKQQTPDGGIGAVSCTNGLNGQGKPTGTEISFNDWLHLPQQAGVHPKHFDTGFLFIPDLTAKATGAVLITLIVLYVGTQLASSLLMSVTADRTQRLIFMALPFFFVIFIINFPAGLLVYWITTNTWTIVQQYIVRRTVGPIRPPLQADGSPAPSPFAQLKEALSGATGGSGSGGGGGSGGESSSPKGGNGAGSKAGREKVAAGAKAKGGSGGGASGAAKPKPKRSGPPPSSPRKKKKRSGRRR